MAEESAFADFVYFILDFASHFSELPPSFVDGESVERFNFDYSLNQTFSLFKNIKCFSGTSNVIYNFSLSENLHIQCLIKINQFDFAEFFKEWDFIFQIFLSF